MSTNMCKACGTPIPFNSNYCATCFRVLSEEAAPIPATIAVPVPTIELLLNSVARAQRPTVEFSEDMALMREQALEVVDKELARIHQILTEIISK